MTDSINSWLAANLVVMPLLVVWLYISSRSEVKRLDGRINAVIKLLKLRGIDLNSND